MKTKKKQEYIKNSYAINKSQQLQQQQSIHPVQKVASTSNDNGKVFTQFKVSFFY